MLLKMRYVKKERKIINTVITLIYTMTLQKLYRLQYKKIIFDIINNGTGIEIH
jgi:hypothetical protein